MDAVWTGGWDGPILVTGLARDLLTDPGPAAEGRTVGAASLEIVMSSGSGNVIESCTVDPPDVPVEDLVGRSARAGLRKYLHGRDRPESDRAGLCFHLLDEIPAVAFLSRVALHAGAETGEVRRIDDLPPDNTCEGWVTGSVLRQWVAVGHPPYAERVEAPPLEGDDPLSWHEAPWLPEVGFRRRRRLDVWLEPDGGAAFDTMFRDTHRHAGREWVVHEYSVTGGVDADGILRSVESVPRVLPGPQCPAAAVSAGRLVGRPVAPFRENLRPEMTGVGTCTHLTDALRALGDVAALVPLLLG